MRRFEEVFLCSERGIQKEWFLGTRKVGRGGSVTPDETDQSFPGQTGVMPSVAELVVSGLDRLRKEGSRGSVSEQGEPGRKAREALRASKVSQGGRLARLNPASLVSTQVSFVYIVALLFSIVENFVFNSCNEPHVTGFIVVNQEDCSFFRPHIHTIRQTRDYIGTRTLLFLVQDLVPWRLATLGYLAKDCPLKKDRLSRINTINTSNLD